MSHKFNDLMNVLRVKKKFLHKADIDIVTNLIVFISVVINSHNVHMCYCG